MEAGLPRLTHVSAVHKSIKCRRPLNWDKEQCTREYSDKVSFMAFTEYQFALSSGFTRIHFLWYDYFHKIQNWLCYVSCLNLIGVLCLFPTEMKKTTTLGPCICVCVLQTAYVSLNFQLFENCVDWMGRGIPFTSMPKRWQCWVL